MTERTIDESGTDVPLRDFTPRRYNLLLDEVLKLRRENEELKKRLERAHKEIEQNANFF